MDGNGSHLELKYEWTKRPGVAVLSARLNGEFVAVEEFKLANAKKRNAFASTVCDGRPGIDRKQLEAWMLDLASKNGKANDNTSDSLTEVDISRIVRPERFILPEVSSLCVPIMAELEGGLLGRWQLYLRWSSGERETRKLQSTITLPDGGRLYVHPEPTAPSAGQPCGWSAESRRAWLSGSEPPHPANLFKRLCERIAFFLDLPAGHAPGITATLALWIVFTYVFSAWSAVPYLFVGGTLGSGKSRVFEILSRLVFRPLGTSNLTAAALFRTLHSQGGVLLLDEAERLRQTHNPDVGELLSMLLAGQKKGGRATRLESIGDTFRTIDFDVFGPKAVACISGLPPALASRCIPIVMFRSAPNSPKPRRRIDEHPKIWQELRDDLHVVALEWGTHWLKLAAGFHDDCPSMSGRDYELWQPLLAIASWIESHGASDLVELIEIHAKATIDSQQDELTPDADATLLRALADKLRFGEQPTPQELLEKCQEAEPTVFKGWHPRTVTRRLKTYGLAGPKKVDKRREFRGSVLGDLEKIQRTYGIDLGFDDTP